jgi:hypothetical protein
MAQQYKPGDWYEKSSGNVMQYDGSKWKDVGQRLAPGGQAATASGRQVQPPGAAVNPVVAEEAAAVASYSPAEPRASVATTEKTIIQFSKPKSNVTNALRYPSDPSAIDSNTDYVIFSFYKYDPPFGKGQGGDSEAPIPDKSSGYNLYAQSGVGKIPTLNPIILYMPEDIQGQYSARWGGAGFGTLASGLMNLAGTNLSAIPAGFESLPGVIKSAVFDQITQGINGALNANVSINQVMGGVSGTILNPNVEMMYEAPDLRGFSLSFKMTPRSSGEASNIKKICNRFKKAMLPSFGGQAIFGIVKDSPNLLTIPNVCQVSFMRGNDLHPYLPQYKLSAITDVSVNYTPDGSYATYSGGSPVATELKVSLKEMKILFSDEINEDGPTF